jgi:hypothetical protein
MMPFAEHWFYCLRCMSSVRHSKFVMFHSQTAEDGKKKRKTRPQRKKGKRVIIFLTHLLIGKGKGIT